MTHFLPVTRNPNPTRLPHFAMPIHYHVAICCGDKNLVERIEELQLQLHWI